MSVAGDEGYFVVECGGDDAAVEGVGLREGQFVCGGGDRCVDRENLKISLDAFQKYIRWLSFWDAPFVP